MATPRQPLSARLLAPIVSVREGETLTAVMMFAYAFLAMTAYNIVKPITKSKFIEKLGAEQMPYALLIMAVLVGLIMQAYSRAAGRMPRKWVIPLTQAGMAAVLVAFWTLFKTGAAWVPIAFYVIGYGIFGILMVSQFWTLANDVYDARQAKRLFGFIGGGTTLGGIAGSAILTLLATRVGTENLLLVSAAVIATCAVLVGIVQQRTQPAARGSIVLDERGVGGKEAIRLLRESPHLQTIALVIAFACIGGVFIEQQLNMAAQAFKGQSATDAITALLGQIQLYTSAIGFVLQVWVTSRLHRFLGIGFALLVLPVSLGATAVIILLNAALWSSGLARVADTSFRYTVDKTTREVLFLPLPPEMKYQAKPFVDVTVDRMAKATGAFVLLVLTAKWGLHVQWWQLSYASLAVTALWIVLALRARRGYLLAFRQSLADRQVEPTDINLPTADLSTIEALIEELGHPDDQHVVYAIDLLESLERRNLITPLLLHHDSALVRIRVLRSIQRMDAEHAARFDRAVERLLKDEHVAVRAAAVRALAAVRQQSALAMMRAYAEDGDPRVRLSAAAALADGPEPADLALAERTLEAMARDADVGPRMDLAGALEHVRNPRFRHILIGLFFDSDPSVVRRAIATARTFAAQDPLVAPALIGLLRQRTIRADVRQALIACGSSVVDVMGHVLGDADEDPSVRREIPGVLARIPDPRSVDHLVATLVNRDGSVRFAALSALERLHRVDGLAVPAAPLESLILKDSNTFFTYLGLRYNIFTVESGDASSLLARLIDEKLDRTLDRVYRTLALVFPWRDIEAARWAITRGEVRARASAIEYLDNLLTGDLRKRVLPILDEVPLTEKVRKGNVFLRTRVRGTDESLAQLVHDEDQIVAASAIQYIERQQRWALADDVEYVLQHRDPSDWYVFEAASWTLAGRRLEQARRRALWLEPLPAIELADRLRQLPLFSFVPVDELVRIGAAGRQVRHEAGRTIPLAEGRARALVFLLDGRATVDAPSGPLTIERPAAIGVTEALRGEPFEATARAEDVCVTLDVPHEAFLTLLADSAPLVRGLFRVALSEADVSEHPVLRPAHAGPPRERTQGALDAVLALEAVDVLAGAATEDLLALAARARTVPVEAGAALLAAAEPAAVLIPLSAQVRLAREDGTAPTDAAAGDAVGVHATLAGAAARWNVVATTPGTLLRIEAPDLHQVLGERPALLRRVFAAVMKKEPELASASD
jgi:ATP:ADP antiporter, AAA family